MDSVTHILSAALFTEPLGPPEQSGPRYARWRERMAVLLAALAPDADGVLGFINLELYAKYHRVVTHSFFVLPIIALLVAWVAKVYPERGLLPSMRPTSGPEPVTSPSLRRLYGFAMISIACHFVGDWIAAWGIWPFWPVWVVDLSLHRVNSLEPILLTLTLIAFVAQWIVIHRNTEENQPRVTIRKAWLVTAVWALLVAIYVWLRPHLGEVAFV